MRTRTLASGLACCFLLGCSAVSEDYDLNVKCAATMSVIATAATSSGNDAMLEAASVFSTLALHEGKKLGKQSATVWSDVKSSGHTLMNEKLGPQQLAKRALDCREYLPGGKN